MFKWLKGPAIKGEHEDIARAESLATALEAGLTPEETEAFAVVAKELTRRFEFRVDVLVLDPAGMDSAQIEALGKDLFKSGTRTTAPGPSEVANRILRNLSHASLTFYYLLVMRVISINGGAAARGPARKTADRITAALRAVFPG